MKRVMIACPSTGNAVFTGFTAEGSDAAGHALTGTHAVGCPHCGELHIWDVTAAWLEEPPTHSSYSLQVDRKAAG